MVERRQETLLDRNYRRVRFSPITHGHLIPQLADMSGEDIDAIWFTEKENAAMQMVTLKTIKYMRKRGMENDKITFRGLEHMRSTETLEQRKINKDAVYCAVLEEQERQRRSGRFEPEEIANASSMSSRWARRNALRLGEADAAASGRSEDGSSESTYTSRCKELSSSIIAPAPLQSKQDQCLSILEQALHEVHNTDLSVTVKEETVDQKGRSVRPMPSLDMKRNTAKHSVEKRLEKKVLLDRDETYSKGAGLFKKQSSLNTSGPGIMLNLRSLMRTRLNSSEDDGL